MVLPGFIATEGFPATELREKALTRWIVSKPETVAEAILEAGPGGKAERYVPRPYALAAVARILAPRGASASSPAAPPPPDHQHRRRKRPWLRERSDSLRPRLGHAVRALGGWRPPTWLLGALVALLGWKLTMNPPSPGLDASWNAGLAMAVDRRPALRPARSPSPTGRSASSEPAVFFDGLGVLSFLYAAGLYVLFCIGLVWALRRALPPRCLRR